MLIGFLLGVLITAKITTAQAPTRIIEGESVIEKSNESIEYAEESYQQIRANEKQAKNKGGSSQIYSFNPCSCVSFGKFKTGYTTSIGIARYWTKNTETPQIGGIVITNESRAGHVAVITAVREGEIDVTEANYVHCKVTSRTIQLNSSIILGYWR